MAMGAMCTLLLVAYRGFLIAGHGLERARPAWTAFVLVVLAVVCLGIVLLYAFRAAQVARSAERAAQAECAGLREEGRAREQAERSVKYLLDRSPVGIMAFRAVRDEQGAVIDLECTRMNEAAEGIVRYKASELLNKSISEPHPGRLMPALFPRYVDVVETGVSLNTETEITRDGQTLVLSLSAVRMEDGLVLTFSDVTEAKRRVRLEQERERLSITGRFARMVGHEVRNPLTNIQLALDQLESENTHPPGQQVYFDILRRNSQRIGQLITEMLHTSRPLEVNMVPGSLNEVLNAAYARVKDRCELRKAACTMDLASGLQNIPIDRNTLTIAFTNLLVNAVEAMEEGVGHLTIRSTRVNDRLQATVMDNGVGMSVSDRERIFQPFFSGRKGGMGLGLTEARNIFNAHNVLLTVESELGKGTTFTLLFPA